MRPPGSAQELERRRRRAVELLQQGLPPVEVARAVGGDRRSVRRWSAAFRAKGASALKARVAPGRPPRLDAKTKRTLEKFFCEARSRLASPPTFGPAAGWPSSSRSASESPTTSIMSAGCSTVWDGAHRSRSVGPSSGTRRRSAGGSSTSGRASKKSRAAEGCSGLLGRVRLHDGAAGSPELGALRSDTTAGPTRPLAPEGLGHRRPVRATRTQPGPLLLPLSSKRQRRCSPRALVPAAAGHAVAGPTLLPGLDRLQAHRAGAVKSFLSSGSAVGSAFLPAYAPELNPVEYVWSYLKINPLANAALLDLANLTATTRHHARSLQRQRTLLRSFIHHNPLFLRLRADI